MTRWGRGAEPLSKPPSKPSLADMGGALGMGRGDPSLPSVLGAHVSGILEVYRALVHAARGRMT